MKTFPCIKGKIGDWSYYFVTMKMAELANHVSFAEEIFPKTDLDQIMQRELTKRSSDIAAYLHNNDQRFMGALIVAAVGGEPKYIPISLGDENLASFAEDKLGILRFDGTEKYYVLDGQHRLAAIREVLKGDPNRFAKDEIPIILVWHDANDEGSKRARRLFTTVNRYAKKTSKAEDLVFDEDNPVDIYTRRLVREHAFFKERTKVSNVERSGEFKLAQSESLKPEHKHDKLFLLSILTLRRCNQILLEECFLKPQVQPQVRPDFETLESGYAILNKKWDVLLENVSIWKQLRDDPKITLDLFRTKRGGNVFARPIAIIAFINAVAKLLDSNGDNEIIKKISNSLGDLTAPPWKGLLWKEDNGGMHDGQVRRNAAAQIFSYYLNGEPSKLSVKQTWESATGRGINTQLTDRDEILQ